MKTSALILAFTVILTASAAFAGPFSGARAERKASAQTRAQNHTAGQNLSPEQQANIQKLQSDLTSIKAGSTVTDAQKQDLKASLNALSEGAVKPSEASVSALTDSLSSALADQSLSAAEKAEVSKNVKAVLTSANIPPEEVEALVASTQAVLTASGVSKEEAQTVANDLRAIGAELKANAPAAKAAAQEKASTLRAKIDTAKAQRAGN